MHPETVKSFSHAIYFCIFIFGLQLTMMGPLLGKMSDVFHQPLSLLGTLFSFSSAGFMMAIIGGGFLSDRIGKKKVVSIAAMGFGICLLFFSASNWFLLSAALLFLIGGFGGVLETLLSALIADIQPGRERASVTTTQVFFGVGAILGPTLAGWIAAAPFSWKFAYTVIGLLALLSAMWLTRYTYPVVKHEERITVSDVAVILRSGRFLLMCVILAIYVGVETAVSAWTVKFFIDGFGYTSFVAGLLLSLFWVVMTFGRLSLAKLSLTVSNRVLIRCLSLLAGLGFILQCLSPSSLLAILSIVVVGLGLSAIWPLIVAEAGTLFSSKYSGTSFGIVIAAGGLGGMVIPVLAGFLSESIPIRYVFGLLSILMIFIAFIHYVVTHKQEATVK